MRAQLLHLSGPLRGRTVTYPEKVVRIGSAPQSEVRMIADGVEPRHAQIEWVQAQCQFHLRSVDGPVFVNGTQIVEVILNDGDELEFGAGGPMARFRVYVPIGAVCKPVRRMIEDAADLARHSGSGAATRMLTKDLLTQATPTLKIGFPLLVVGLAFLVGWFGGWLGSRPSAEEQKRTADMVTKSEVDELKARYEAELEKLAQANQLVRRIQVEYTPGVCLIHGIYRMRMRDDTWLELRPGEPFEIEYTGSGFLVDESGHIVTNRHVALPWLEESNLESLLAAGAKPEFIHLSATFPGKLPMDISPATTIRRPDDLDVAVLKLTPEQVDGIPALPLKRTAEVDEDQRAIVVGYPTGLAALLARARSEMVDQLRSTAASMTDAIAQLAAAGGIAPVITQGIVSNVQDNVIAYDASTTHGGSGGPVFGGGCEVIAVNFAIQRNFGGNNLGVPIRFAIELLPK